MWRIVVGLQKLAMEQELVQVQELVATSFVVEIVVEAGEEPVAVRHHHHLPGLEAK